MSLATRCTACGTVFRVVQDQLKVSEGWVRCGRCEQVFNALQGLFDLERDSPPEWNEPAPTAATPPAVAPTQEPEEDPPYDPELVDRIDEQLFGARRPSAFGALTSLGSPQRQHSDFADARFDSEVGADAAEDPSIPIPLVESAPVPLDAPALRADDPPPEFVARAEREERWRSSGTRKGIVATIVLAALVLVAQAAHHFRDGLAARVPVLQPALAAWCGVAGCTLQPPRRIDDISVESTALAKSPTSAETFRLSVVLRNRGSAVAATPWVELSLTDPAEKVLARRALGPADFRLASAALPAGAETTLQATIATGELRVTGYTVEIFYP